MKSITKLGLNLRLPKSLFTYLWSQVNIKIEPFQIGKRMRKLVDLIDNLLHSTRINQSIEGSTYSHVYPKMRSQPHLQDWTPAATVKMNHCSRWIKEYWFLKKFPPFINFKIKLNYINCTVALAFLQKERDKKHPPNFIHERGFVNGMYNAKKNGT